MATHSSVLAWRIPGTGEPGGLPSLGSHRVGHDWHDLAAACYTVDSLWKWNQKVSQSCLTLCDPMDLVHATLQARILEWVAYPFSRGSSQPRNRTGVFCIADEFFTNWTMRKVDSLWLGLLPVSPVVASGHKKQRLTDAGGKCTEIGRRETVKDHRLCLLCSAIPCLTVCSKDILAKMQSDNCTRLFIMVVFLIAKNGINPDIS